MSNSYYCHSRFQAKRRVTREVRVGTVGVGGSNPVRIQSMTTTLTLDVDATLRQCIALAEAGSEVIRITAQNIKAAQALKEIHRRFHAAGFSVPLVADIHFLPAAAMEAALHVEKVRINPGNFADRKKFAVREYTDAEYAAEQERLYDAFSPLVHRCQSLGRAMRIGVNHGSLSDRIMNRYGDTPLGMVECAMEFIRIAESHGFRDIILSFKASNPKITVQANRLAAAKMADTGMDYPLHLGVTEAGDGEDGRIKGAIGIGSLLYDGLGDTIRVSLTEDPIDELPVARALARQAEHLWASQPVVPKRGNNQDSLDPYTFERRRVNPILLHPDCQVADNQPPRVILKAPAPLSAESIEANAKALAALKSEYKETPVEGFLCAVSSAEELAFIPHWQERLENLIQFGVIELSPNITLKAVEQAFKNKPIKDSSCQYLCVRRFSAQDDSLLQEWLRWTRQEGLLLGLDVLPEDLRSLASTLKEYGPVGMVLTLSTLESSRHSIGSYRALAEILSQEELPLPIWIRNTEGFEKEWASGEDVSLLEAATRMGSLLCDGIGELVSIETTASLKESLRITYAILQASRARVVKTEYVACPSCGRTLFDLQSTTQRIRERTGHLQGVTIAVMGCIVNGPGEMADADFGYVGGAPGKVNLYRGKECVQYNVPEDQAVNELIELLKREGKWREPGTFSGVNDQ